MDEGIGLAMALTLPAAAALMIAPVFLIDAFFTRGEFLPSDAAMSGSALFHFAWGVPAFVLIKVLAPAFFAREDTKTPMRYALVSVVINTVLGAGLFFWMKSNGGAGFIGLAIATSVAALDEHGAVGDDLAGAGMVYARSASCFWCGACSFGHRDHVCSGLVHAPKPARDPRGVVGFPDRFCRSHRVRGRGDLRVCRAFNWGNPHF